MKLVISSISINFNFDFELEQLSTKFKTKFRQLIISKKQRAKYRELRNELVVDITIIGVAFYIMLASRQNRKQEIQYFSLTIKEIDDTLAYYETNSNFVAINIITKKILNNIIKKIFNCLKYMFELFDLKRAKNLSFYRLYNYKIEFIENLKNLLKNKVYLLFVRKFQTFQKYLKKNLRKDFISSSNILFASSILFVVKSNDLLRLYVNYR